MAIMTYTHIEPAPFSPIDYSPVLWLDSSDLSTITKDGSNFISEWRDKSINGYNLIQGTGANQPLYNSINGIVFDGLNDFLYNDSLLATSNKFTMFMVSTIPNSANRNIIDGNSNGSCMVMQTATSTRVFSGPRTSFKLLYTYTHRIDLKTVYTTTLDGTNSELFINNVSVDTDATETAISSWDKMTLGAYYLRNQNYFGGSIQEVIIYQNVLTFDERLAVNNYLINKYSIS